MDLQELDQQIEQLDVKESVSQLYEEFITQPSFQKRHHRKTSCIDETDERANRYAKLCTYSVYGRMSL